MSRCRPPALRNTALLATALTLLGCAALSAPVLAVTLLVPPTKTTVFAPASVAMVLVPLLAVMLSSPAPALTVVATGHPH